MSADVHQVSDFVAGIEEEIADRTDSVWTQITKSAIEPIQSDTVLSDDSDLQFPMLANKTYAVQISVFWDTPNNADFKFALAGGTFSVGVIKWHAVAPDGTITDGFDTAAYTPSTVVGTNAAVTKGYVTFDLTIKASAAGTFAFQWAQNVSQASDTSVLPGSGLRYKQVD